MEKKYLRRKSQESNIFAGNNNLGHVYSYWEDECGDTKQEIIKKLKLDAGDYIEFNDTDGYVEEYDPKEEED